MIPFTTLRITNWNGIVQTEHVTGVTEKPGEFVAFDRRDEDGVPLRDDNGKILRGALWLKSPAPGVMTAKKIELFSPSGACVETLLGQPPEEAEKTAPKGRKKAA